MMRYLSLLGVAASLFYFSGCSDTLESMQGCDAGNPRCTEVADDGSVNGSSPSGSVSSSSSAKSSVECLPNSIWCANGGYKFARQPGFSYSDADIWSYYTDAVDGGASVLQWPVPESIGFINKVVEACDGFCLNFSLVRGKASYEAYVGAEVAVAGASESGDVPMDVVAWKGLCIDYQSDVNLTMELGLGASGDKWVDYDLPNVVLPISKGETACFTWDKFRQYGWSKVRMSGKDAAAVLVKVKFKIQGMDGVRGNFVVRSIGVNPDEIISGGSPSLESSSSSMVIDQSFIGKLTGGSYLSWLGSDAVYQIDTDLDCGTETSGYWYVYDDAVDGGASKIVWPVERGNEYSDEAFDPVIDYCGGICGTFVLDKGFLDYNPMVGVAFNVAGVDYDNRVEAADASLWGGLCIAYKSTAVAFLEIVPTDEVEKTLGYDIPFVTLSKVGSNDVAVRCFEWDKFKQAGWGPR
ncbi:MAG: hypothetical protein MJZ26_03305 [Fibrobacter sp.]|nr:hypothetical protein [Fibrobacter sp.]